MLFNDVIHYITLFSLAAIIVLLLTPLFLKLAPALGLLDIPSERCIHQTPIPVGGGIVVFIAFHSSCYFLYHYLLTDFIGLLNAQWWYAFLIASSILLVLGLIDDRCGMSAVTKLSGQALATICFYVLSGHSINLLGIDFGFLGGLFFILIWSLAIINAFNLIDGLDGLCSGLALISATGLAGVFIFRGVIGDSLICLALVGACSGFLYYNFFPAKVFLGDTGSMFLGFALAIISLHAGGKTSFFVLLATPFFIAGIPLIDTMLAIWRRSIRKRIAQLDGKPSIKIMQADKEHLHHRLLNYGLKQYHVALLLYAVNISIISTGLLITIYQELTVGLLLIIFIIGIYLLIKYVLQIELWETQRLIARNNKQTNITRFNLICYPLFDLCWLAGAVWLTDYIVSLGAPTTDLFNDYLTQLPLWEMPIFCLLFYSHAYIRLWRNSFFKDYLLLMLAVFVGCAITFVLLLFFNTAPLIVLLNKVLLFCLLAFIGIVFIRVPPHFIQEWGLISSNPYAKNKRHVLLYGAGMQGSLYLLEPYLSGINEFDTISIIGFIDDNILLRQQFVYGKQVLGDLTELQQILKNYMVDEIIVTTELSADNFQLLKSIAGDNSIKLFKWQSHVCVVEVT